MNHFSLQANQLFGSSLGTSMMTVVGAVLIFLVGWAIATLVGSAVRKLLAKSGVNSRMNSSTGTPFDMEKLVARVVFWFVFVMGIAAAMSFLKLDAISTPFANMINQVLSFIPNLLGAATIAVLGWVLATATRSALNTTLSKTTLDETLAQEAGVQPMSENIANIAYWFILLMFVSMILEQLGLTGLLAPVNNMMAKVLEFLPNVATAIVIFFIGFVIARILRGITTNLIASLNIQALVKQVGIEKNTHLANIFGTLVYLLVMITTLIIGLDTLKIEVISRPATNMLNQIMLAIPNIIAAIAILGVAYYVVKFVANIVSSLLENTGINDLPTKIGLQEVFGQTKISNLVGGLIVVFAMLFATIESANRLGFTYVSDLVAMFIEFIAQIMLGSVILTVGFWLANRLATVVARSQSGTHFLANLVRVLVMGLVLAMGLRAMGIADSIVNLAFGLTLGSVAVAFALAFGLGGREAAARFLKGLQDKAESQKLPQKPTDTIEKTVQDTSSTSEHH